MLNEKMDIFQRMSQLAKIRVTFVYIGDSDFILRDSEKRWPSSGWRKIVSVIEFQIYTAYEKLVFHSIYR